jgi:hypothetical protein
MYCVHCGASVPDQAKYCPSCGKATVRPSAGTPVTSKPAPPASSRPRPPIAAAPPRVQTTPEPPAVPRRPAVAWVYGVGAVAILVSLGLFVLAFSGMNVTNGGASSMFWNGLFAYLLWKRMGRTGWHGALIGVGVGLVLFVLASFVSGYIHSTIGR